MCRDRSESAGGRRRVSTAAFRIVSCTCPNYRSSKHMTQHRGHPTAEALLARLTTTPDAYVQKLDLVRESCLVVELDEAAYRAASFLDDRTLGPATRGGWLPFDRVLEVAQRAADLRPLHFIFHTGHVGSTLVSRLLDETGAVLSLREPLPLRTLADACDVLRHPESLLSPARFDDLLAGQLRLWSRGYAATKCVVVKATSSAARLGPTILARHSARAIYLNQGAESALATLLAGQNSSLDLRGHGPGRMQRLCARLGRPLAPLHELSPGELAAMSWLAESMCRHDVLAGFADQVLAVDFDAFLADVGGGMRRVLAHFGLPIDEGELSRLAASPVLTRYSKAPEHPYGPMQRTELLDGARREHRAEISRGLAWLAELAQSDDTVAAVLRPRPT
jgi:hypothetical protein